MIRSSLFSRKFTLFILCCSCRIPVEGIARVQAVETLLVRFINILEAFANAVEKQDNRRKGGLTSEPELFNEHTRWIETMPVTFLEEHRVFVLDGVLPCVVSFFRTGIYSPDVHPKVEGMTESLRCALMKIFHSKEDGADIQRLQYWCESTSVNRAPLCPGLAD